MTKSQEIEILKETIVKLGNDSYCGPWIAGQLGAIESAINSDYLPGTYAFSPAEAFWKSQAILAEARKEAGEIRLRAERDAARTRELARDWAGELRQSVCNQLQSILSKF
jgi:hypothetical protein